MSSKASPRETVRGAGPWGVLPVTWKSGVTWSWGTVFGILGEVQVSPVGVRVSAGQR